MGFALVVPFLPYYVRELGVHNEAAVLVWTGWLSTAAGVVMAIMAPIWGTLADRYGRKLMVLRSMFGGVLVLSLMAFVRNVYQLLGLRMMQGLLTGTVSASVALVSSVVPTRRAGFALGLMQTALYIGNSLGPGIGGRAADAFGYRIPFLIAAGFLFCGGMLVWIGVKETPEGEEMEENGRSAVGSLRAVLSITGFLAMAGLLFLVHFSGSFLAPILPLYIEKLAGLPPGGANTLTGDILTMAGIAAAVAAALLGRIGDSLGYTRVLAVCTLFTGLMLIPHAWVHNPTELLYWRMAASFAGAGTIPAINALIRNLIPREACGRAYGMLQSISCLGWGVGPIVGGAMAAHLGLRLPFIVVGVIFIALTALVLAVAPRMTKQLALQTASAAPVKIPEGVK